LSYARIASLTNDLPGSVGPGSNRQAGIMPC